MGRPNELFLVWQDDENDGQYYNQYTSLTDAVSQEGSGAEIFKASLESLGSFKLVTKVVKKSRKKDK